MTATADIQPYIDEYVSIALARLNFWEFCLWYDEEFFTEREFIKDIADAFQYVHDEYIEGRARKVSISMPPRAGKSYVTSCFCAWWLGKFPEKSVMRNTCTATLYAKFSYDVRNIVKSDKYKKVFPTATIADDKQNLTGWNLKQSKQVGYFGAGVGGTIIGFGANIAISDDLYKDMQDALSETVQESVSMWKQSAHNSRMEKNCPEIFIGTRWTKRDEIGKAIEESKINKLVVIPALINGKSFCENVKSTEEYLKIKAETEESIFEAEYMQNPVEVKGLLFPKSELKFYNPADIDVLSIAEYKALFVDPNAEGADYFAAVVCCLVQDRIYVTKVLCNKYDSTTNIQNVVDLAVNNKVQYAAIESNGAFIILGKQAREKIGELHEDCEVRLVKHTTNKETRILMQSSYIKNRFYFPVDDSSNREYSDFLKNLTGYLREGKSKHDDVPDVVAFASDYFMKNFQF